jgi:hypothetical protein
MNGFANKLKKQVSRKMSNNLNLANIKSNQNKSDDMALQSIEEESRPLVAIKILKKSRML